jgi:hypothetical protein
MENPEVIYGYRSSKNATFVKGFFYVHNIVAMKKISFDFQFGNNN